MSEKERVNRVRTCTDATFQHMEMVERLSAREETMEHAAMERNAQINGYVLRIRGPAGGRKKEKTY